MFLKVLAAALFVLVTGALGLVVAWQSGYISRVVVLATSPDASLEAVCRGRLPEQTEYDLWLRERGATFGRRLGQVGTESMGRTSVSLSASTRLAGSLVGKARPRSGLRRETTRDDPRNR